MSESETRPDDTNELASGRTRHSDQGFPPPGSMRTAWKTRLGLSLWAAVVAFASLEILNRIWLGWYHVRWVGSNTRAGRLGWWTNWHWDPASIAAISLALFGVWWEAGRIGRPWLRRTIRITWAAALVLALIGFSLSLALRGMRV